MQEIAHRHAASPVVALAWLLRQPTVTAPLTSAISTERLAELAVATRLELADAEVERLAAAAGAMQ